MALPLIYKGDKMAKPGRPSTIVPKLRKIGGEGSTAREVLSDLYATRTIGEIATMLGVTNSAIFYQMKKLNIRRRPQNTQAPKSRVAQELTRRGRTTNQTALVLFNSLYNKQRKGLQAIANQLGVSPNAVRNFARTRGITLRPVGRPKGKTTRRSNSINFLTGCL